MHLETLDKNLEVEMAETSATSVKLIIGLN